MLLLLALLLFFDAVNAASSFANITSKATLPTSKPSSTVAFSSFSSCPDVAFDCNRPGPYGFPEIVEVSGILRPDSDYRMIAHSLITNRGNTIFTKMNILALWLVFAPQVSNHP